MEIPTKPKIPFLRKALTPLWDYLYRSKIVAGSGITIDEIPGSGTLISSTQGESTPAVLCPFGKLTTWQDGDILKQGILGGAFIAGDKNYNVPDYEISPDVDGEWLVEISLSEITANTDDDITLILGGIETATGTPSWNKISYTGSQNYTDSTNFASPTSTGTLVVPIGRIVVESELIIFHPLDCGSIIGGQCNGILSHSRI